MSSLMTGVRSRNVSEPSTGTSPTEGAALVIAAPAEPFHMCCGECGTIDWYHEGNVECCSGFTMKFRLVKEKGDTVDIAEISPEKKDTGERSSESQDSPDLGDLD
jgi:hypothetical protein